MSLAAQVQTGVAQAFTAAGDLVASGYLRRTSRGNYQAGTGKTAELQEQWTCKAVTESYRLDEIDDEKIKQGDRRAIVLMEDTISPVPGDHLVLAGVAWRVIIADPVSPGDDVFVWILQVRK